MNGLLRVSKANAPLFLDRILEVEDLCFSSPWPRRAFRAELDNELSRIWACRRAGQIAGYICYWVLPGEIQVLNLAVHPTHRRAGLGSGLLACAVSEGRIGNAREVWLEVRVGNHPARRLYEKHGFREVGRRRRYYRDTGEDAIVMRLPLSENGYMDRGEPGGLESSGLLAP